MQTFFEARRNYAWTWRESLVLLLYTLVVAWATAHHEPWGDEAQAWLIARDLPLSRIFLHQLHHEGTPGLWYILLRLVAWCHMSYAAMHWVTASFGVATAFLLLRYSPFPAILRYTLPFVAAFAYQGPIVARSYVLTVVLVLALAAVMRASRFRPWLFVILNGLLANTSAHGMLMAFAFAALYFVPMLRRRIALASFRPTLAMCVFLLAMYAGAFYTALPSPETSSATHQVGGNLAAHPSLAKALATLTTSSIPQHVAAPHEVAYARPHGLAGWQLRLWEYTHGVRTGGRGYKVVGKLIGFVSFLVYTVSSSTLLGLLFYLLLLPWLVMMRGVLKAAPLAFFFLIAYKLGMAEHHLLLNWGILVATLWLAWPQPGERQQNTRLHDVFSLVLLLIVLENAAFTGYALVYDTHHDFDGAKNAATYLATLPSSSIEGFNFHSITLAPYFNHSIFTNQSTTYWPWSVVDNPDDRVETDLSSHPRYVIVGAGYFGTSSIRNQIVRNDEPGTRNDPDDVLQRVQQQGYREVHRFCGAQPMHFGTSEQVCEILFEYAP